MVGGRLFSWWWKTRKHWIVVVTVALMVVFALIICMGYWLKWGWTGFLKKTLWDWLNLLGVLAIPVAVALGTAWFTAQQGRVSDAENKDNQRHDTLQTYIDKMAELLLEKGLRESRSTDEVRTIARVRTLTTLTRLDGERKKTLLLFLKEVGLMKKDKGNIDLNDADLSDAKLSDANLMFVNLSGASLFQADLSRAKLFGADLSHTFLVLANLRNVELINADLSGADLTGSDLSDAKLTGACFVNACLLGANLRGIIGISLEELEKQASSLKSAAMPDGSVHP